MKTSAAILTTLLLLAVATTAWADVAQPMVQYVSIAPSVNTTVYHPFKPGGESIDLGRYTLNVDLPGDNAGPFVALGFCVDIKQYSSDQWKPYSLNTLEYAPQDNGSAYQVMGAAKANAIRELWGEQYASIVDANTAAAFQAAVWEIIYEDTTSYSWDLTTGDLKIADATVAGIANGWLALVGDNSQTLESGLVSLTNNTSDTQWQDYVIKRGGEQPPVPEPVTMITLAMGISGLGMYVRRRTVA